MDAHRERQGAHALRAYVQGDFAEVDAISAFRSIPIEERADLVNRHRGELAAIDGGRLLILESLLLPLEQRKG